MFPFSLCPPPPPQPPLLLDVCLKDTMSVADSLYNLQLIKDFCESRLQSCCPLAVEDLLYAPPLLHVSSVWSVCQYVGCY